MYYWILNFITLDSTINNS